MPPGTNWADFVLSHWSPEEWDRLAEVMPEMLEAVECWIDDGIEIAMNRFNRREKTGD